MVKDKIVGCQQKHSYMAVTGAPQTALRPSQTKKNNKPSDRPHRSQGTRLSRAHTHILCLFMKKRPWQSLLLKEVYFSLMSIM